MTHCLIAFGGNLSNPKFTFQIALSSLSERGFDLTKKSGLWRSPAWPQGSGQPDYLNAVVSGDFNQGPEALLALLHQIEAEQGRVRSVPNAARTLDLDLLVFGEVVSDTETLKLPHPRMLERTFVLLPASEIEMRWLEYLRLFSEEQIRSTRYVGPW